MYSMARLCIDQFLVIVSSTSFGGLSMLYTVDSNSNHCLFNELPSASNELDIPELRPEAHRLEFVVLRCIMSQLARSFLLAQV